MPAIKPAQLWVETGPPPGAADSRTMEAAVTDIAQATIGGPGVCVEVVAGLGDWQSNVAPLFHGHGWSGVLAERSAVHFDHLRTIYADFPVDVVKARFGVGEDSEAFEAVSKALKGRSPDMVSLRLFGSEWSVWNALPWKPKIVTVIFNPTFNVNVEFVQADEPGLNQGASLLALWLLAKEKGYSLVHVGRDAVFVEDASLGSLRPIAREELREAWGDRSWLSHLVIGFDGKLFLAGNRRLQWNRLPYPIEIQDEDLQALPVQFRRLEW